MKNKNHYLAKRYSISSKIIDHQYLINILCKFKLEVIFVEWYLTPFGYFIELNPF